MTIVFLRRVQMVAITLVLSFAVGVSAYGYLCVQECAMSRHWFNGSNYNLFSESDCGALFELSRWCDYGTCLGVGYECYGHPSATIDAWYCENGDDCENVASNLEAARNLTDCSTNPWCVDCTLFWCQTSGG
jgi:hypothetical protein